MNIQSNPWSFVAGDLISGTITSITQQANLALFTLVMGAAFNVQLGQFLTIVNQPGFNGWYKIISGAPGGTTYQILSLSTPTQGSPIATVVGGGAGGTALLNQVQQNVRIEDISWQNYAAADTIKLLDRNGNLLWTASSALAESNAQGRGKLMWVDGITLQTFTSANGSVLVTIN